MQIINKISDIRKIVKEWKRAGKSIGFVATMGYFHNGHKSLIDKSVKDNDKTVLSIYVNPTQFAIEEDLDKYPRDMERDSKLAEDSNVDVLFFPDNREMYGDSPLTKVFVENLSSKLCGKTRPTHFAGVTLIVSKLFNIVTPDNAYFGLKDFQQYIIIKKMVEDLNIDVNVEGLPIIRDKDGLALSSRNKYLSDTERQSALLINQALIYIKNNILSFKNNIDIIDYVKNNILNDNNIIIDYIELINPYSLEPIKEVKKSYAVLIAAFVGKTRLIDNLIVF